MLAEWKDTAPAYKVTEPSPVLHSKSVISGNSQSEGDELTYARQFTGRAQVFEANIDTDAIIPAEFMPGMWAYVMLGGVERIPLPCKASYHGNMRNMHACFLIVVVDDGEGKYIVINGHVYIYIYQYIVGTSDEDLGTHCFQYVRPEFRSRAKEGFSIVVAGSGFGSGSSREEAVRAIKGYGGRGFHMGCSAGLWLLEE